MAASGLVFNEVDMFSSSMETRPWSEDMVGRLLELRQSSKVDDTFVSNVTDYIKYRI